MRDFAQRESISWPTRLLLYPKSRIEQRNWRVSALPRLQEDNHVESDQQDAIGLLGLGLAIAGVWEMPLAFRLLCFLGGAICLPICFSRQTLWPKWVRWLLSIAAVALLAGMSWSVIRKS